MFSNFCMPFNNFTPFVFLPFHQGVTYCGESTASSLTMANVPWHEEVVYFVQQLANLLPDYEIACEHEHSNCLLLAHHKVTLQTHLAQSCCSAPAQFCRNTYSCLYCNFSFRPLKGVTNKDATSISVNVIEKKVLIWALALNCHSGEGLNLPSCIFMLSPDTALVILAAALVLHLFLVTASLMVCVGSEPLPALFSHKQKTYLCASVIWYFNILLWFAICILKSSTINVCMWFCGEYFCYQLHIHSGWFPLLKTQSLLFFLLKKHLKPVFSDPPKAWSGFVFCFLEGFWPLVSQPS